MDKQQEHTIYYKEFCTILGNNLNGKRIWKRIGKYSLPRLYYVSFTDGSVGKESAYKAGDTGDAGSIPASRRSPGGENGDPLQYSCLKNPIVRGAWWATVQSVTKKSDTTEWQVHMYMYNWITLLYTWN